MDKIAGNRMSGSSDDLMQTLIKHDGLIQGLGSRIDHVEKTLGDHGAALSRIEQAVTKVGARPEFDFYKTVKTVQSLAVLFAMVVGGVIWITTSQFSNVAVSVERHDKAIEQLSERVGWTAHVDKKGK